MIILRNIPPFQQKFSHRCRGNERGAWLVYTLLAVITCFTSSRSANLLRCLQTLFGLSVSADLHLHGLIKITLGTPLDDVVVSNTQPDDKRTAISCLE